VKQKSNVILSPLAGKPAPKEMRVDVARLESEYFARRPDLGDGKAITPMQYVALVQQPINPDGSSIFNSSGIRTL
jgi:hypothetical protein